MNTRLRILFIFLVHLTLASFVSAQPYFQFYDSIPVRDASNAKLLNPWAGGINSGEFSEVDLNLDGKKDLLVFDKSGYRINTFINEGQPGETKYRYNPKYGYFFPNLQSWALMRDYNNDGKADIFTYKVGAGAMSVWKNTTLSVDTPRFILAKSIVYSDYINNNLNLYVSAIDIPDIDDMDGDGDLDIITLSLSGGFYEFHENQSQDIYGNSDSLEFKLKTSCWGQVSLNPTINSLLFDTCSYLGFSQSPGGSPPQNRDLGSTAFSLDMNNDGAKELVIGDISFNNMTMYNNTGTVEEANVDDAIFSFPPNNPTPVNLSVFVGGFYLDLDNDGVKDFIASPNSSSLGANAENNWFYRNTGQTNQPNFTFQTKKFLNDGMIEVGEGAYPVLVDLNQDSLLDLVVGNRGMRRSNSELIGKISFYQNIGTLASPEFKLITDDLAGLSNFTYSNPYPAFSDLDGDGDKDMLFGRVNGNFTFFRNTAQQGSLPNFVFVQDDYQGLFVGQNSFPSPQFFDVDNDGLTDLMVGEYNGTLNYFRNTGTISNPVFSLITDTFGKVKTLSSTTNIGYSTPAFFRYNGETRLYCGSEAGTIFYYDSIDGNLGGKFRLRSQSYMGIDEGSRTALSLGNLNNDTLLDLVIGNYAGGVAFYIGTPDSIGIPYSIATIPNQFEDLTIYPNPVQNDLLTISLPDIQTKFTYILFDVLGRKVLSGISKPLMTQLNVSMFDDGIYYLSLQASSQSSNFKIAINR